MVEDLKAEILEYLSQTNNNLDFIEEDMRFKYFDDASVLEIVNLLSIWLVSHNSKQQDPSHIPSHNQFLQAPYMKSQEYLETLNKRTKKCS